MVIIIEKYGQLGNRLFSFSHLIGNSIENKYKLFNPSFEDYAENFEFTHDKILIKFKFQKKRNIFFVKLVRKIVFHILTLFVKSLKKINLYSSPLHEIIDNEKNNIKFQSSYFKNIARKKFVFICNQFYLRDYESFWKFENQIKNYLIPRNYKNNKCLEKILKYKKKSNILIGVHFRAGDYRTWMDGKYFIDFEKYLKTIDLVTENFQTKPLFLIFSNEKIVIESDNIVFADGDLIEDLYCLSMCNYIISGYSSFAYWASFYGSKPIFSLHINDNINKSKILLDDFVNIKEFGHFP